MNDAEAPKPNADHAGSVGTVKTQTVRFDQPLELAGGQTLPHVEVAYETYGELNATKTNAVLICHALSGDAHVAGYLPGEDKAGWWDRMVGPGKPIDTDRYFVLCTNVLGGCKGTTGPGSIDPQTGRPWGLNFPVITIADMVAVQVRVLDHFGIDKLLCATGGSMGGMQALELAVAYPDRVAGVIPIATTASVSAQSLAFDAVGRNAIICDAEFHDGHYEAHGANPANGLAIARMLGHITYLSEQAMHEKFGRTLRHGSQVNYGFDSEYSVETYLDYQGDKFVERFDANTYLYVTRAIDYFDLGEGRGGLHAALASTSAAFLVISFTSDWLFPATQSQRLVRALSHAGKPVSYINIDAPYGHDSFLLDCESQDRAIAGFLNRLLVESAGGTVEPTTDGDRRDLDRIESMIGDDDRVLDLGCGDGALLAHLKGRGLTLLQGVDLGEDRVVRCIENGVDVIHADLDKPLDCFDGGAFDAVVLSRTLQVVHHPGNLLDEMLRVGRRSIVSFPNFGYWRNRHQIAWTGRVPVSRNLPFSWADTPNLHFLSMKDFEQWCAEHGVSVLERVALDYESGYTIGFWPNLRATDAIYAIARG